MKCPKCKSSQSKKNGFRRGKQSYRCKNCGTQYVANPSSRAYSQQTKQTCIEMYLNGMGIRGISRVTKISHVTILNWIQSAGETLSDEPQDEEIPQRGDGGQLELNSSYMRTSPLCAPEITEIDELQTFVGNKQNKYWIWTVVNHQKKGIILWAIGDRSHQTFDLLWSIIKCWHSGQNLDLKSKSHADKSFGLSRCIPQLLVRYRWVESLSNVH